MATFREFAKENSDGWSLVVVKATIDSLAEPLRNRAEVTGFDDDVDVHVMANSKDEAGNDISFSPSPNARTCFAVATGKWRWCIVFRTLYWCDPADHDWVNQIAASVSESLGCDAIASCGGGHGLSTYIYPAGTRESELPAFTPAVVGKEFTARKIQLPMCFIGGTPTSLYADQDSIDAIVRADRYECSLNSP